MKQTYTRGGLAGFYPRGTAIAFRQATNWASRQGFTEFVRARFKLAFHDGRADDADEGGGSLRGRARWHGGVLEPPVRGGENRGADARQRGKARGVDGDGDAKHREGRRDRRVVQIAPRVALGIWQTLFMVTGAKLIKDELKNKGLITK